MTQVPTPPNPATEPTPDGPGLDAAQQSLSDALRVSFRVLKVLMAVLFVAYLASGVFRVDEQNTAVRYIFGEQIGEALGPGWHVGWPFPIEQVVMVPRNTQTVNLDKSFWYDNPDDLDPDDLGFQQLDPLKDSFLITGDTNIVHVQFKIEFVIRATDADVNRYLVNVGSLDRAHELIQTAAERGMIHAIASSKVEDIVILGKFPPDIKTKTQAVLDKLETGIQVQQVLIDLKNQSMPNQVRQAYTGVTQAQADKGKAIQEARASYRDTLVEAAGAAHEQLLAIIRAYESALGYGHASLAEQLRGELDRSIEQLRLPDADTLALMERYIQAGAGAVIGGEADAFEQAREALAAALAKPVDQRQFGPQISGAMSERINEANANRTLIRTRAQIAWEDYATALLTYNKSPRVFVNSRLQATRTKIFADSITQTYIGVIGRIDTGLDPESQEDFNNADFDRRRQNAAEGQEDEE